LIRIYRCASVNLFEAMEARRIEGTLEFSIVIKLYEHLQILTIFSKQLGEKKIRFRLILF